jgi:ribosome-associated protein
MEMQNVLYLREDHIKLGQALKAAGLVESGADAKLEIQCGRVMVNGYVEVRRGRKLVEGDVVELLSGESVEIVSMQQPDAEV